MSFFSSVGNNPGKQLDAILKTHKYKTFVVLFIAIFTAVTGVGIVVPLLPVYAYNLGANGIEIGLILGSFSLSRGLFLPYFGQKSDLNGRKPYIVTGLFCYTIVPIGFVFSKNVESIIVIRFIQGIASAMIIPAVQAYIGETTSKGNEGKIMGIFNMSIFIGLSAGPLIGGLIKDKLGMNTALLSMGFFSLIGFLLSQICLPPKSMEINKCIKREPAKWRSIFKDRTLIGLVCIRLSYTTCIGIIWGFLPILAHREYNLSASATGVLIMLGIAISGLLHTPMGWLSDKMDRKMMIIAGGTIVIISIYSFTLSTGFWTLACSNILFGSGGGLITPPMMAAAVVRGNKNNAMGSVMAVLTTGHSIGMLAGSCLAGIMMNFFELKQSFYLGLPVMIIGLIFFVFLTKKHQLKNK